MTEYQKNDYHGIGRSKGEKVLLLRGEPAVSKTLRVSRRKKNKKKIIIQRQDNEMTFCVGANSQASFATNVAVRDSFARTMDVLQEWSGQVPVCTRKSKCGGETMVEEKCS